MQLRKYLKKKYFLMKRIKCLSMLILALGFFAFSANAQNVKEERKQALAEKLKTYKTLEATPIQAKTATTEQVTAKVRPSGKSNVKGERKERPNATKKIEPISVNATKKSGIKVKERPKYDFSANRQQLKAKRAARTSKFKFDRNTMQQKIKERKSNQ